ncbi:MAG: hypothetical protein HGA90_03025, partial [Alphaproteobacteria bacterium]|nr:hypothetical protein [Alphaproteobacteria bacterium]
MNMWGDGQAGGAGLRWLVLDLNSFFASCEQQENEALRGQPIAVVPMLADTTCAIAASYEAKAFGIKTGTMVREAKRLCPNLRLVVARPKLYVEYHHRILDAIETCMPIDDVMSIDEVACRLDKIQERPEEARQLAVRMKAAVRARAGDCMTSSVGIAPNRLLAKLASDMRKPDGLTLLRPVDLPRAILHLKPQDICGIGPNMAARLRRFGITDMAALWAVDAQQMRRVWGGITGARFHALLHGADLPSPAHPRRSLGHQHVLAPEQRHIGTALAVARQLLTRAAQRLRDEGFYCRRLILDVKWMQDLGYAVEEKNFKETQDTGFLLKALMGLWGHLPALKPLKVGVTLAGLVAEDKHQPDLFDRPTPAALTAAVDRINGKFGRGTVAYGAASPDKCGKI